ncbi:G5 domain-containing protein [Dermabacter vaginalis]|uniref:G5 domain-containing protein n=1 Tax=Dermabacter vaginalis TaxID=1630135 RepID=UPI001EF6450C|nr:G5 domain-containing protein [Dermabacter vaginalis]MCG7444379.1 G5 domain-containing protein [Dermabacter vaginalis]
MASSRSTAPRRLRPRAGVAALSAVALAVGALGAFPHSIFAPQPAAAATLTGGIRGANGEGVVEKDAQMASDLPAGTCTVQGTYQGSQAGFSWDIHEPGKVSADKRSFGVQLSFDGSQDRTFNDWLVLGSNNKAGEYVNKGDKPALGPNDQNPFDGGKPATDMADEVMSIQKVGREPLTATIAPELTGEKIEQYAKATAEKPVRYLWADRYKQDNTERANHIFNTPDVKATVNPWPSENVDCNPITVTWYGATEKHVIVPGEETKVGHINVPKSEWGDDDSLSRIVVEANDGTGKFLGTSDSEASGGGENLLRVDENGDIFYTWPAYRDADNADQMKEQREIAGQQNVNFSVIAKPRTVKQLENAAVQRNNGSAFAVVSDESNSLKRYNTPNVIDSKAFSLDDTMYHDPGYDKADATIISGVEGPKGPLAEARQSVTFTQVPDRVADLIKKKGDGGQEATVALDETYVYDGWDVALDPATHNVTVTAPENPVPGTFAQPRVVVTYSNGSKDVIPLLVVIDPNNTQVTDLVNPGMTKGAPNTSLTSQITTKPVMKGKKAVAPAKFEVDPSTVPSGWTVTVDEKGNVTAKADDTVPSGTVITPKVTATYPDQTTDEIKVQFQVVENIKVPEYPTVTGTNGDKVSLPVSVPEKGLSGSADDAAPNRYTFEDGSLTYTNGDWTVTIDENTGELTSTIPASAEEGDTLDVPVLAHYGDGVKPQKVTGTIAVVADGAIPSYSVESTSPNTAVTHKIDGAPKGSTFSFGIKDGQPVTEQEVDGWKYTIDPKTGNVTATPPANAKPGDKKTVSVTVNRPDGSTPKVPVTTVVNLSNNWEADPTYPEETVYPGGTATLPVTLEKPENVNVAKENPYKLGTIPDGWTVTIDDKGQITATAPADAEPGTQVEIPVTVTYEDGSTDTAKAVVNVVDVPTREVPFKVEYKYDDTIPAGEYKVETKGEPGSEKQNKDGSWEQTKAPVNEVVVIGTKPAEPAEAAKDVTWTVPIPYPTEVRENPDLKPGETRVVQEGENGEKKFTAKFTAKGDKAEVVEEETTKEPVKRIVEYGPGLAPSELVTKTEKPIPFPTKVVFDDTLEAGKQVVDQKGEVGTEVETSTQKIVDGKPSGEPTVTTERTKEPTEQIIRVGTKTTGETTNSVETEVPFGVKVEFDPNMPAGTSETVTEGKPGKKTITVTQKVTNSQPDGEATVEEKVTEEPVDQVIKVGTKPSEASEKVTWTAQVPFEVETRPNPELKPGEIKVVQKGVPGEKTYTADFSATGDQATVTPEEKQTKDPVNEIIEYGPAAEDTSVVTKTEKPVPFETEIVFDNTLKEGEQKVDQQGETGTEVVTSTQKIVDGKPSGEPTVTTERTKEPVKQIIRVGTKTTGENVIESEVEVPFETEIQFDDSMPAGTQETVQEGKPGKDKVTTTQTIENSKVTGTTTETERIAEPVKKIIKVGTKGDTTSKTVEWTESTPFEVEVRENPKLKAGETKVVQEGKPGEVKHTVTVTSDNGEITTDDSTETVSEPTKQIIEVGTAPSQTELTDRHTEQLPFETIIEADPNLESGKVVEDQAGAYGEKEVTKVWKLKDGVAVGDPETTENVTKEPTPRKLRVGTKTAGTNTETFETEVPFGVKVVYDPNMPAGESKVTTEGKPGKKTVTITREIVNSKPGDPEISEEITEQPVDQVITVGTKPGKATDELTWTTAVGYETIMRPNPDLAPGEVKVVQEGEFGEKTITVKFDATIEEGGIPNVSTRSDVTTKDPKPRIVEYGPRAKDTSVVTKIDRPIPFETEIITDDTLESGTQVIDQKGENGVEVVTSTQKIVDGKPSGDPEVTTERTKEPVKQIIRIGTKCDCDNPTPGEDPTPAPGEDPSDDPTTEPTPDPTDDPSTDPTDDPTTDPTEEPTPAPTDEPTTDPTDDPTTDPTEEPTPAPTDDPTTDPTDDPTTDPTDDPTTDPTEEPTPAPTDDPAPVDPTDDPSVEPGTPGTPDEPGTPDQPGTPEKPTDQGGTPDQPGTPEKPADQGGTPDQPGTPEKPADQGGTPDQPGTPEKPADQGGTPDKQDRPEASSPLPLPRTGAEIAATAGIAALLVLGGVGVLALRRKSRSQR